MNYANELQSNSSHYLELYIGELKIYNKAAYDPDTDTNYCSSIIPSKIPA